MGCGVRTGHIKVSVLDKKHVAHGSEWEQESVLTTKTRQVSDLNRSTIRWFGLVGLRGRRFTEEIAGTCKEEGV